MARVTRDTVVEVFRRFLKAYGLREASAWNDAGGYTLDHNATYGGYVIEKIETDSGAVSHPFGQTRQSGQGFVDALNFALNAQYISSKHKANPRSNAPKHSKESGTPMGQESDFRVDVWEERDRLVITLYALSTNIRNEYEVATWSDDDARQLFEDGYFERGRNLRWSVLDYANAMGLIKVTGHIAKGR